jgi:hypothetical protein
VIACLRSARFFYPDRSATIFVELRRHHDTNAIANNKEFIVTKRTSFGIKMIHNKSFGTIAEARRHWIEEVHQLEDHGLVRSDIPILGFHEEG